MDIPFWFWTSVTGSIAAGVVGTANAMAWLSHSNRLKVWPVYVHVACCITWLVASWSVFGFGIAWVIQSIK